MVPSKSDHSVAERATLVILYVETRGFTRMSEILQPAVVLARISEFFVLVTKVIEKHNGTVRDLLNDNVVASFEGATGASQAVQAAQEIQREFTTLEEAWQRDYSLRTAVAMGLHCGDTVIGPIGDPLPAQTLIIGDGLSIAERLLHRARAGEFVMSKAIIDALAAEKFALDVEELPPLAISRRDPIQVFGVMLDTRLDFTD